MAILDYAEYECGCALYAPGGVTDLCPVHARKQTADDADLMERIREMLSRLLPDEREKILGELANDQSITPKETTIQLEGFPEGLKISFGRPIAWMNLPKAHAVRLAMLMLEACGAKFEKPQNPTQKPPLTI